MTFIRAEGSAKNVSAEFMHYDIIVIGASMGGFHALRQLISDLPADLPASVFVVLHIPADHESFLAESFRRTAKLPVVSARDGDPIRHGHVYVAVPDYHLCLKRNHISLEHTPKHNFHRPAVDRLFTSAAEAFGARTIGVILTGALDDGTAGLMDIKRHGGMAVIQDPTDAVNPSMPLSAQDCVPIDHCTPLSELGRLLSGLAGRPVEESIVREGVNMPKPSDPRLSTHICPDCNGPMWVVEAGKLLHFHCRIGHAFSGQSLLVEKTLALESALWSAVNALKDQANISSQLAKRASGSRRAEIDAAYFLKRARTSTAHAELISDIILKQKSPTASAIKKPKRKKASRTGKNLKAA